MNLEGRRQSSNVEDRRRGGGKVAGMGIGGAIIVGIIALLLGKNPTEVVSQLSDNSASTEQFVPTEQEQEYEVFARQILASTEDVWTKVFQSMGKTYKKPTMVFFKGSVQSGCGNATSSVGPFYCSADQKIYIDLDFFTELDQKMGAGGDFAFAYVIAHEVGHHVQNLLGTLGDAHAQMAKLSESESNKVSVRVELQADYYAGVWGYYENKLFGSLDDGDMEEAINAAQKIGDDYLQKQAYGNSFPEKFTHGTSAQRVKWLKKGLSTGNMNGADTFTINYNSL